MRKLGFIRQVICLKEESSYLSERAEHSLKSMLFPYISEQSLAPALQEHMACELEEGESLTVGLRDLRAEPLESQGPQ